MRILYHHRTQGEEPESVHIASIVEALRRAGHEVDIVGPVRLAAAGSSPRISLLGRIKRRLPQFAIELVQIVYNGKSLLQLLMAMRSRRYDFIYERYALYNMAGMWAAAMLHIPIILEVNTCYAQAWSKYYGLKFPRLARAIERYVFTRADRIITVTERLSTLIAREGVPSERITVCHNAIDPEAFAPASHDRETMRRQLELSGLIIGFVGTMNRWQGVHGFVDVIRRVADAGLPIRFLFVGDGEGRARLTRDLDALGLGQLAFFAGRQPHAAVAAYLAAMDIGVLLDSNDYGSPMKVFEYWGMGKAVIAPRVAPVMEILRDGETGLLIDPGDSIAMAAAILRLAHDPALLEQLGRAGRDYVLRCHTWAQNAARVLAAYQGCRAPVAGASRTST